MPSSSSPMTSHHTTSLEAHLRRYFDASVPIFVRRHNLFTMAFNRGESDSHFHTSLFGASHCHFLTFSARFSFKVNFAAKKLIFWDFIDILHFNQMSNTNPMQNLDLASLYQQPTPIQQQQRFQHAAFLRQNSIEQVSQHLSTKEWHYTSKKSFIVKNFS
jgi:hypothetical protein